MRSQGWSLLNYSTRESVGASRRGAREADCVVALTDARVHGLPGIRTHRPSYISSITVDRPAHQPIQRPACFTPDNSALPPKPDVCGSTRDFCFGPDADKSA